MITRLLIADIHAALDRQASVALLGPRQAGKTTLALEVGQARNALYLDLEDMNDRQKLENPVLFLEHAEDRLVILDEIHRIPKLFESLRGIIDTGRRRNKGTGRFLMLGSASLDLMRHSSESLAGRVAYIDLAPLSTLECADDRPTREQLWLRGGFPQSFLASTDADSLALRKDFIRSYLERDIPLFGPRIPSTTLERLWTMLAHRQGSLLNASALAKTLEVSTQSITRYIDLLCDLFLLRRLQPYTANIGKRLVKSPKVYVRDSGLLHALLGLESFEQLAGHPVVGASWEGFVIETLLGVLPWRIPAMFYRTAAGAEVDLVLELEPGKLWAIEIKRSPTASLGRGFHEACKDLKPERSFLVHAGDDRYPVSDTVEAIGVRALAEEIRQLK